MKNKKSHIMKRQFLTILFLIVGFCSYPQVGGFLSYYEDEERLSWDTRDAIETENGDYLVSLKTYNSLQSISKVLKLSNDGVFCQELPLEKTDTSIYLTRIFPSKINHDNYIGFAACNLTDNPLLMTIRFDEDLNVINQKIVELPYSGNELYDISFISLENEYIAAVTFRETHSSSRVLYRISEEGDILQFSICEADSMMIRNLFHVHNKPNCFGMYIGATSSSDASTGIILFDEKLQIYKRAFFGSWTYTDSDNHQCFSCLTNNFGSMLASIPDGNYVISSNLSENTTVKYDRSAIFVKVDTNFVLMPNRQVIGHLNDTLETPAFFKSIDYTSDAIYQCSMQNMSESGSWPWQSQGLNLVVTKTDFDLNIIWQKRLLLDGDVYTPTNIIATSDGGCLITGMRYNHNNEWRIDVFALKLNADGTYNGLNQPELTTDESITVYPNPTSNNIVVSGDRLHEVEIYNFTGQKVASYRIAEAENFVIDMSGMPSGFYLVNVTSGNGKRHVKKVVKE